MRYFLLEQDEDFSDVPYVKSWPEKFDVRKIKQNQSYRLPRRVLLEIHSNEHTVFSDVIVKPFLLFSNTARETVSIYESRIPYKQVVLLDVEYGLTSIYFLPVLETVDCLSPKSELNPGRTVIRHAIIEALKLPDRSIFKLGNTKGTHIVVRLDLAESLLRRNVRGINFREIEVA